MRTTLTPRRPTATVRAGLDAYRVEVLRDLAQMSDADGGDPRAARARARVFERVRSDLDRLGLAVALARAAAAYRNVPVVPPRLYGRHPAARARGEAFERVFEAAGVDPRQVERLRRVRPRFVDDPQAAS
jgi:hypothetical protein